MVLEVLVLLEPHVVKCSDVIFEAIFYESLTKFQNSTRLKAFLLHFRKKFMRFVYDGYIIYTTWALSVQVDDQRIELNYTFVRVPLSSSRFDIYSVVDVTPILVDN